MEKSNLIAVWKKNDGFSNDMKPSVSQQLLHRINGGGASAGNICSISAECTSSKISCEVLIAYAIRDYLKMLF
jgi:hypothetical protein